VKASEEQIARYLEGNWQEDLLFVLKQGQEGYEFCQQQMAERDRQVELQPKTPDFIPIGVSGEACGKCRILVWRARCSALVAFSCYASILGDIFISWGPRFSPNRNTVNVSL